MLAPSLALRRRIARAGARLALRLTGLWPRVEGLHHLAGAGPLHPQGVRRIRNVAKATTTPLHQFLARRIRKAAEPPTTPLHQFLARRIRKAAEPPTTPLILVANHASYLDALILTAVLPPRFAYVAKQELLQKPFAGIPLRRLDAAFVERFDSARGAEDTRGLEARARTGDALIFFPEGTFQSQPGLLPFRMGAFVAAARAGAPVAPVALLGTRALLRGESFWPCYSTLQVRIGTPLTAQGEDWQAALRLRDAARRWILARLDEPDTAA
ncbi:MAG: lysophospholipid acyltransferase family protein [Pseudomonadota bacterium]|nr:lysophospholipid acyltransferase family protein [Pseudomonadota bacterium]